MTVVSGHVYPEIDRERERERKKERESQTDGRKDVLQRSSLNLQFVLIITLNLNRNTDVSFGFIAF
jgi:hypothetical protein